MMHFHCPTCAIPVSAPESCAGRTTRCPRCGRSITVPSSPSRPSTQGARPSAEPGVTPWWRDSVTRQEEAVPAPQCTATGQPMPVKRSGVVRPLAWTGAMFLLLAGAGIGAWSLSYRSPENLGGVDGHHPTNEAGALQAGNAVVVAPSLDPQDRRTPGPTGDEKAAPEKGRAAQLPPREAKRREEFVEEEPRPTPKAEATRRPA